MTSPIVRHARPADVPQIIAFMHETAKDQDVPHAVKATEKDLLESIDFEGSDSPKTHQRHAKVLLIESPEGQLAGMATYFYTFAAWISRPGIMLEDLYVQPEYRRRGYARILLEALAKEAESAGCERIEWMCFKENHRALKFYRSLGAKELDTIHMLRLDSEAISRLAKDTQ